MLLQRVCGTESADGPNTSHYKCLQRKQSETPLLTRQKHYVDRSRWFGKSLRQTVCEIVRCRIQKQADNRGVCRAGAVLLLRNLLLSAGFYNLPSTVSHTRCRSDFPNHLRARMSSVSASPGIISIVVNTPFVLQACGVCTSGRAESATSGVLQRGHANQSVCHCNRMLCSSQ